MTLLYDIINEKKWEITKANKTQIYAYQENFTGRGDKKKRKLRIRQ